MCIQCLIEPLQRVGGQQQVIHHHQLDPWTSERDSCIDVVVGGIGMTEVMVYECVLITYRLYLPCIIAVGYLYHERSALHLDRFKQRPQVIGAVALLQIGWMQTWIITQVCIYIFRSNPICEIPG
jgi:hypothetical protein